MIDSHGFTTIFWMVITEFSISVLWPTNLRCFLTTECREGYYLNGAACDPCGVGKYSSVISDTQPCDTCPVGMSTVQNNVTDIVDCSEYQSLSN